MALMQSASYLTVHDPFSISLCSSILSIIIIIIIIIFLPVLCS